MESRILILMSTYNGERYLSDQLDSIARQQDVDWHLLVRDDGSSDSTTSIISDFIAKYSDRVELIVGENKGFARSFTILIDEALRRYPGIGWFAFADQDDVWLPAKLHAGLEYIHNHTDADSNRPIVYSTNTRIVEQDLKFRRLCWSPGQVRPTLHRSLIQNFATGCTMIFNRRAAELYASCHPDEVRLHDFLMYQIGVYFGVYLWDAESYILYRQHGDNQLGKQELSARMEKRARSANYKNRILERQSRKFLEGFGAIMTPQQHDVVETFVNYRRSWFSTLCLLCSRKYSYTILESDFFYRLKVLLRGV